MTNTCLPLLFVLKLQREDLFEVNPKQLKVNPVKQPTLKLFLALLLCDNSKANQNRHQIVFEGKNLKKLTPIQQCVMN